MRETLTEIREQVDQLLHDLHDAMSLSPEHLLVIGTSTSEIIGEKIGTSGTMEVANAIYETIKAYQDKTGVQLAFQCCEHLNRVLLVEEETGKQRGYEKVSAVPILSAGGAMATYAYDQMRHPVLVESIRADAGIDIGDVFIGMHLRPVAVPVRSQTTSIGKAHVTMARTRPKLIGGVRATYEKKESGERF